MNALTRGEIHPTAIIADSVLLGKNVTIGANCIIHENVSLGDDCVVGTGSILGEPNQQFYQQNNYENPQLKIGSRAIIRSQSLLYADSIVGDDFQSGHRVTIRERTQIGNHVRVGTLSDIQGDCVIGNYVRLHSNVHIGQKSVIKEYVWIFPYVVLTNDPHPPSEILLGVVVHEFAVIATMSVILPGVQIGRDALVGAMSLVRTDVPDEAVVVGNPAKIVTNIREIKSKTTGQPVYPWREHFERGMPWQGLVYEQWLQMRTEQQ